MGAVASTYKLSNWGIVPRVQKMSATVSNNLASSSPTVVMTAADWSLVAVGDFIFVSTNTGGGSTYGNYAALKITGHSSSPNVTVENAWGGSSGTYDYWFSKQSAEYTARTLGDLTKVSHELVQQQDVIGIPLTRYNGTLLFDVSGNVRKITVEGQFWETGQEYSSTNIYLLEAYTTDVVTGVFGRGAGFFWCDYEQFNSSPRAFPVAMESIKYQHDVGTSTPGNRLTKYSMNLIGRNPDLY
jgi:hypothetical protein